MSINVLPKNSPRGRGPEPSHIVSEALKEKPAGEEEK